MISKLARWFSILGLLILLGGLIGGGEAGARAVRRGRHPAPVTVDQSLRVFEDGTYQFASPARLRAAETWVSSRGHQHWRTTPLLVLLVETGPLLEGRIRDWVAPAVAQVRPGLKITEHNSRLGLTATYTIQTVTPKRITASLQVRNMRYRIVLQKPLQTVWWVTKADPV